MAQYITCNDILIVGQECKMSNYFLRNAISEVKIRTQNGSHLIKHSDYNWESRETPVSAQSSSLINFAYARPLPL